MTDRNPWMIASTSNGYTLHKYGDRFDIHFRQAVQEIAEQEDVKYEDSIGATTIIWNLVVAKGPYANDLRRKIRKRMKQLQEEKQRHAHQDRQIRKDETIRL